MMMLMMMMMMMMLMIMQMTIRNLIFNIFIHSWIIVSQRWPRCVPHRKHHPCSTWAAHELRLLLRALYAAGRIFFPTHPTFLKPVTKIDYSQVIAAALQSLSFDPNYLGDDEECDGDFDDDDDGDDDDTFWKVRLVSSRLLASCARSGHVTGDMLLRTVLPPLLLRLQDRVDIVISESLSTFKEILHRMGSTRQLLTPADIQRFIKCVMKESSSKDARLQENLFAAGLVPQLSAHVKDHVVIFPAAQDLVHLLPALMSPHVPSLIEACLIVLSSTTAKPNVRGEALQLLGRMCDGGLLSEVSVITQPLASAKCSLLQQVTVLCLESQFRVASASLLLVGKLYDPPDLSFITRVSA
jgi:hypothetical protein